jgi:non-canonical purine NTP pyrophosphatase (RdgB/HAM1 family)
LIESNKRKSVYQTRNIKLKNKKIIYYATTNAGKFDEVKRYIDEHEPSIEIKQFDQDLPEIQTLDQKAIALDKANQAWNILQKPVLVDDSGVFFDHYNNFPGTMSKFIFKGIGFEGLLKLAEVDNRASFRLNMVYKDNNEKEHIFEGVCKGTIVKPQDFQAHASLPYDAIFLPAGSKQTMAKLRGTEEEKKYSYRLKGLQKFLEWYQQYM